MNPFLFTDDEEKKYALACLKFSKKLGLIDDDSLEAVIKRCDAENEKRKLQTLSLHDALPISRHILIMNLQD